MFAAQLSLAREGFTALTHDFTFPLSDMGRGTGGGADPDTGGSQGEGGAEGVLDKSFGGECVSLGKTLPWAERLLSASVWSWNDLDCEAKTLNRDTG